MLNNHLKAQDINLNQLIDKRLVEYASRSPSLLIEKLNDNWSIKSLIRIDENYYYVISESERADSAYYGFAKKITPLLYRWTWGIIESKDDRKAVVCGNILQNYFYNPPKKILPLKYYYQTSSVVYYYGEQHPYPVQKREFVKFNSNGTGYVGFQFNSYEVAPLEEAANHYSGGRFGRLTGGFSYWTEGEVHLKCKYTYDDNYLTMVFDGSKATQAPISKLDLSKKKLENLSTYGNYDKMIIQQIKADFPTNFYVKQTKAGFKDLYNEIKPVKGESRHILLYCDENYQFLISPEGSIFDILSYGFVFRNPEDAEEITLGRDDCFAWLLNTIKKLYK